MVRFSEFWAPPRLLSVIFSAVPAGVRNACIGQVSCRTPGSALGRHAESVEQDGIENHLELTEREREEAEERSSVNVRVVHEAVRREGEEELERSSQALGW